MRLEPVVQPGRNCWRAAHAGRVGLLIDADAYFSAFRAAAMRARRSILILGWDVDSRTALTPEDPRDGLPRNLGDFLHALVRRTKSLTVRILDWDFAMIFALEREILPIYAPSWRAHRRLRFHLDDQHPVGASHHQKIVVIDDQVAFVGGLDLTIRRWDTPEHLPVEPRRVDPNGTAYPPFHDVQMMVDGDAALALAELARERWRRATGSELRPVPQGLDPWPQTVQPDLSDVQVAIARTEAADKGKPAVQEIKQLYLDSIAGAKRWIYFENQFFASAEITEALAMRLQQTDGPEVVLVSRLRGGGWLEQKTMDVIRSRLLSRLRDADRYGRLRMYYPDRHHRADLCIQLHSKLMLADGRFLRIGSANVANRSMGLDTECDLAVEAADSRVAVGIEAFRDRLLGEHLGVAPGRVAEAFTRHGSLIAAIEELQGSECMLAPLDLTVDPELDKLIGDSVLVDPERPIDAELLAAELVPHASRPRAGKRMVWFALLIVALAALAAAWRWGPLAHLLNIEALEQAGEWLRASPAAPLWIVAVYITASLLVVPITLLIFATAVVFDPLVALLYALSGSLAGAAVGFGAGRLLGRRTVRAVGGRRLNELSRRLARRGLLAIIAVRVLPVAPFTVVNLVAGASHIRLRDFILGTLIGMAPGMLAVTLFSDRLVAALRNPSLFALAALGAVIAVIAGCAIAARRWLGHRSPRPAAAPQ